MPKVSGAIRYDDAANGETPLLSMRSRARNRPLMKTGRYRMSDGLSLWILDMVEWRDKSKIWKRA